MTGTKALQLKEFLDTGSERRAFFDALLLTYQTKENGFRKPADLARVAERELGIRSKEMTRAAASKFAQLLDTKVGILDKVSPKTVGRPGPSYRLRSEADAFLESARRYLNGSPEDISFFLASPYAKSIMQSKAFQVRLLVWNLLSPLVAAHDSSALETLSVRLAGMAESDPEGLNRVVQRLLDGPVKEFGDRDIRNKLNYLLSEKSTEGRILASPKFKDDLTRGMKKAPEMITAALAEIASEGFSYRQTLAARGGQTPELGPLEYLDEKVAEFLGGAEVWSMYGWMISHSPSCMLGLLTAMNRPLAKSDSKLISVPAIWNPESPICREMARSQFFSKGGRTDELIGKAQLLTKMYHWLVYDADSGRLTIDSEETLMELKKIYEKFDGFTIIMPHDFTSKIPA